MASTVKLQTVTVAHLDNPTEVATWLAANPVTTLWQVVIDQDVFYIFYT